MLRRPFKNTERALSSGNNLTTTADISARMGKIRQHGTKPELVVRRAARLHGARFTCMNQDLPGSPDLANRTRKFAVFVNGCYWHRHEGCSRATIPRTNIDFWLAKFFRNVARDKAAIRTLKALGFRVAVIWECETEVTGLVSRRLKGVMSPSNAHDTADR